MDEEIVIGLSQLFFIAALTIVMINGEDSIAICWLLGVIAFILMDISIKIGRFNE